MFSSAHFPNIASDGYEKTSCPTYDYNCIAWAAGDTGKWWWPLKDLRGKEGFWPKNLPRDLKVKTFAKVFKDRGYINCQNGDLEVGWLKIAIYAKDGVATHAARQLASGKWTHKMGSQIDLSTSTHRGVEGPIYGQAVRFLKIRVAASPKPASLVCEASA